MSIINAKMWIVKDSQNSKYYFCRNKEHAISVLDDIINSINYEVKNNDLDKSLAEVWISDSYMISGMRSARMELNVSDTAIRDIYHRVYTSVCPESYCFEKEYCYEKYQGMTRMYGALLKDFRRVEVYHDIYYV